jgi:DNA-binding MarR family transcriptional regulator
MGEMLNKWLKMKREPGPLEEALLNIYVAAHLLKDNSENICLKFGITGGQYNMLRILNGVYPGGHPRCEIATRTIERAPDITRLIDRLEKQHLVERDRTDDDRRKSITKITKKGIDLLRKMKPELENFAKNLGKKLTMKEAKELSMYCEKLYSDLI